MSTGEPPFLELVICTYNNAAVLAGALEAISQQDLADSTTIWGVLVVNNNCTDETESIVESAVRSRKIPNLRMVVEPVQGLTPARLCGVKKTTAPWIAFVDDDCYLSPTWVSEAVKFASSHPNCGAFGGRVPLVWETLPPLYVNSFKYSFAEQELGDEDKLVSWLVGAGMVLNRSALATTGWITHQFLKDRVGKTLVSGGDMEIALRLASHYDLWYIPRCQLFHQISACRIQYNYLLKINHGLGYSQAWVNALLWEGSYSAWFLASISEAWKKTTYILKNLSKAIRNRESTRESSIMLRFWWGYWIGIWHVAKMPVLERQQLMGSARVAR